MMTRLGTTTLLVLLLGATPGQKVAADDFGVSVRSFPDRMVAAFRKIKEPTKINLVKCLDGGSDKRTVCTYKLD